MGRGSITRAVTVDKAFLILMVVAVAALPACGIKPEPLRHPDADTFPAPYPAEEEEAADLPA